MILTSCQPTLEGGVKFVAMFEIVGCIVLIAPLTILMTDVSVGGLFEAPFEDLGLERPLQFWVLYAVWMITFITLLLNVVLYRGAKKSSIEACHTWIMINSGIIAMTYIWSLLSLNLLRSVWNAVIVIVHVVLGGYRGLVIFLVYEFMQDLKKKVEIRKIESETVTTPCPSYEETFQSLPLDSFIQHQVLESKLSLEAEEAIVDLPRSPKEFSTFIVNRH